MKEIEVFAPAKVNLFLEVLNKRKDGYHNIESIMQSINLKDKLSIKKINSSKIRILSNNKFIPHNKNNLCFKAAELLLKQMKIKQGVEIKIEKKIPLKAGLAGGSSDASATLQGLNLLFQLDLKRKELQELGKKIGADVPFCILGGLAKVEGIGEILTLFPSLPSLWFVLIKPNIDINTKKIYHLLDRKKISTYKSINFIIDGIKKKSIDIIRKNLFNKLEQIVFPEYLQLKKTKKIMEELGCENVLMSGSGSVLFSLFKEKKEAEKIYIKLSSSFKEVFLTKAIESFWKEN